MEKEIERGVIMEEIFLMLAGFWVGVMAAPVFDTAIEAIAARLDRAGQ